MMMMMATRRPRQAQPNNNNGKLKKKNFIGNIKTLTSPTTHSYMLCFSIKVDNEWKNDNFFHFKKLLSLWSSSMKAPIWLVFPQKNRVMMMIIIEIEWMNQSREGMLNSWVEFSFSKKFSFFSFSIISHYSVVIFSLEK